MLPRFELARRLLPLLALGVVAADGAGAQPPAAPLSVKIYNADAGSFHVNAVVVSGRSEAMVIDSGFTRADALRVAANVLDSGKTLSVDGETIEVRSTSGELAHRPCVWIPSIRAIVGNIGGYGHRRERDHLHA